MPSFISELPEPVWIGGHSEPGKHWVYYGTEKPIPLPSDAELNFPPWLCTGKPTYTNFISVASWGYGWRLYDGEDAEKVSICAEVPEVPTTTTVVVPTTVTTEEPPFTQTEPKPDATFSDMTRPSRRTTTRRSTTKTRTTAGEWGRMPWRMPFSEDASFEKILSQSPIAQKVNHG